jgi:outer membrane lipopolysaccharide assembly protein LptE/RlpB
MVLNKSKLSAIILLIVWLCGACGYRFEEQGGFPGDTERLFVKVLENKTQETGVESIVTEALLNELTLRKTNQLASGIDDADVVLSGVVNLVTINTVSVSKPDVADERRVNVTVDLILTQKDDSIVWAVLYGLLTVFQISKSTLWIRIRNRRMLTAGMQSGCFRNALLSEPSIGSAMISRR